MMKKKFNSLEVFIRFHFILFLVSSTVRPETDFPPLVK